jgi:hypothetical protein
MQLTQRILFPICVNTVPVLVRNEFPKKEPFAGGAGTYEGQELRANPRSPVTMLSVANLFNNPNGWQVECGVFRAKARTQDLAASRQTQFAAYDKLLSAKIGFLCDRRNRPDWRFLPKKCSIW